MSSGHKHLIATHAVDRHAPIGRNVLLVDGDGTSLRSRRRGLTAPPLRPRDRRRLRLLLSPWDVRRPSVASKKPLGLDTSDADADLPIVALGSVAPLASTYKVPTTGGSTSRLRHDVVHGVSRTPALVVAQSTIQREYRCATTRLHGSTVSTAYHGVTHFAPQGRFERPSREPDSRRLPLPHRGLTVQVEGLEPPIPCSQNRWPSRWPTPGCCPEPGSGAGLGLWLRSTGEEHATRVAETPDERQRFGV